MYGNNLIHVNIIGGVVGSSVIVTSMHLHKLKPEIEHTNLFVRPSNTEFCVTMLSDIRARSMIFTVFVPT